MVLSGTERLPVRHLLSRSIMVIIPSSLSSMPQSGNWGCGGDHSAWDFGSYEHIVVAALVLLPYDRPQWANR